MKKTLIAALSIASLSVAGANLAIAENTAATKSETTTTELPKAAAQSIDGKYATSQSATDWRSSKLVGLNVYNSANEKVGDINDLIIDAKGAVTHAIVGVGGFLGIGEKNVAVEFSSLKMARDKDGKPTALLDTTKESLTTAPMFKFYTES